MTAAFATPEMADVTLAHVFRPVRCNQPFIASNARNSIRRMVLSRDDHLGYLPTALAFWREEVTAA